jgi:hypothetical protein
VPARDRATCVAECRALTGAIYRGLDPTREIEATADQGIGDTVLIRDGGTLSGFAICHVGAGSEAGNGSAYVKFAAAQPGPSATRHLGELLSACETFASASNARQLVAGVNTARHDAYRVLIDRGFRTFVQGVAMQRPDDPGFNRRDCFVLDDWR